MKQTTGGNFSVYLDNSRAANLRAAACLFDHPHDVVTAATPAEILPAFERLRHYLAAGYFAAGWVSYETGLLLEDKLKPPQPGPGGPNFLSFGIYQHRIILNSADNDAYWDQRRDRGYCLGGMRLNISPQAYQTAVAEIAAYLRAGDIYQVNFTLKALFDFTGSAQGCFAAMRQAQRVAYGAFITTDHLSVLSLSPELFFQKSGDKIITRPMKGTWRRGRSAAEDQENANALQQDDKNRAENLMIVDLVRNDLAKISSPGSVRLKSLYDVEKYRTLFQMTSTVESRVSEDVDSIDLMMALFPCGSITGAPKIRAMEIISELERAPRGIYTGAIGYLAPDGDCCFSVPIRTMILDHNGHGEMGIGSGIVADSVPSAEYQECLLKAGFVTGSFRNFDLIETMLWSADGGYSLLDRHLARLGSSAHYFDFPFDEQQIMADLQGHREFLAPDRSWKIRLLLSRTGDISLTACPVKNIQDSDKVLITLSDKTVSSANPMLFHKTTDRELFDRELRRHQKEYGSYDVVFVNENGEVTEGSFNNIFLKRGPCLYTPPVDCGLLNGTLRQALMADPAVTLIEQRLTIADLAGAELYMGNSVRGMVAVTFSGP